MLAMLLGMICSIGGAQPALTLDFEGVSEVGQLGRFSESDIRVVTPGYQSDQCIARRVESTWAQVTYTLPRQLTLTAGSRIGFAHRVAAEGKANYIGCYIYTTNDKVGLVSVPTGPAWQVSEVEPIGAGSAGHSDNREPIAVGDIITKIALYGRLREHGEQTTYRDDITVTVPGEEPIEITPSEAILPTAVDAPAPGELFSYDFEDGAEVQANFNGDELTAPGHRSDHGWTISGDAQFLELRFDCDFTLRRDMYLEFDSKVLADTGDRLYIGLYLLREDGQKRLNSSVASTEEWEQNASNNLTLWGPAGHSEIKERGEIGERYTQCVLYSKLGAAAPQTLIVDNLRLVYEGEGLTVNCPVTTLRRVQTPRVIDGDLGDWIDTPAASTLVIGEADHVHQSGWYSGPEDASALAYLTYDATWLHAAFVVTDDVARNGYAQPDAIYQADACGLVLTPSDPALMHEQMRAYLFSPGDFAGQPPLAHVARGIQPTAAKVASRHTPDGYVIEASIPRSELPFGLDAEFGIDVMLYDGDATLGAGKRDTILTWASTADRYDASELGLATLGDAAAPGGQHPGDLLAAALIQKPLRDPRVFVTRPIEGPVAESGIALGLFFDREDVPALREKTKDGRAAACADVLLKTCDLYLETVRPARWDWGEIDDSAAALIEKYLVRLSFAYVLTEDSRFAELARRVALGTCDLQWPGDSRGLELGLACALDWIGNALTEQEAATISVRLPYRDDKPVARPPVSEVAADALDRRLDARLASVTGPSSASWAFTASSGRDANAQWLGDHIYAEMPSQSTRADEVWTIIFHDPDLEGTRPDGLAEVDGTVGEVVGRHQAGPWLPFERDSEQPIREELVGNHPRLLITPDRLDEMPYRYSTAPPTWKPSALKAHTPEPPNRRGNGGGPGYVLLNLAGSYLATGQDFYAQDAIHIMMRVSEHPHWGGHNHLPADIDLDAGALLYGCGVAYDTFYDCMTPDQRAIIRAKLEKQARRMYGAHSGRQTRAWDQNHTYIDLGGLWCAAVALYDEVPEAKDWYDLGVRVIKNGMFVLNAPDGAFYEGPGYWNYGIAMHFVPFMDLFRNVTGVDTFGYFNTLENTHHYLAHMLLPGGRYQLNMYDAGAATYAPASNQGKYEVTLKTASEYESAEAAAVAWRMSETVRPSDRVWPLMWSDPGAPEPEGQLAPYHHFTDMDLVMIRSGWDDDATHFAMRCGPAPGHRATQLVLNNDPPDWTPGTGHVHPDLNGFVIFDRGEHLAVDPGYTVLKKTRNHNTIAIDGGGQIGDGKPWPSFDPWDRFARIGAFFAAPDSLYYVRGEAARGYEEGLALSRFDRHVMMVPGEQTYFIIHDQLESGREHEYEWLLHSNNPANGDGQRHTVTSGERSLTAHLVKPAGLSAKTETVTVVPHPGREHTAVRGKRLSLTPRAKSADQEFLAALTLHAANEEGPSVTSTGDAVTVDAGADWRDTIAVTGSGGGIDGDGHHGFVREAGGELLRWGVVGATRMTWRGEVLLESETKIAGVACSLEEATISVTAAQPCRISVRTPFAPASANDQRFEYDPATKLTTISLPAGKQRIVVRAE